MNAVQVAGLVVAAALALAVGYHAGGVLRQLGWPTWVRVVVIVLLGLVGSTLVVKFLGG